MSNPLQITADPITMLMDYEVEAGRQHELISAITELVARHFAHVPGFISSTFHAAEDGRRVIGYSRWASLAQLQAATGPDNPATPHIIAALERCGGRRTAVMRFDAGRTVRAGASLVSA